MNYDMLILGAGCAGLTAGIYGARAGKRVLILENKAPGGQGALTARIDNYPGVPEADGFTLMQTMADQARSCGAEILCTPVGEVDLSSKTVLTEAGFYSGTAMILATGAKPRRLGIPGEAELTGKGVSYCASCDSFFYRGKTVYVVGGGNSAGEEALHLARMAKQVHLLVRKPKLRCQQAVAEALSRTANLTIHYNRELTAIIGTDAPQSLHLRHTDTGEEEAIPLEPGTGIFVFVGYTPASEAVRGQLSMDDEGYVLTDDCCRTSLPGIFAAGDVRQKPLHQLITAAADGAIAAHFAADIHQ